MDRSEVSLWIEDALSESLAHSEREDLESAITAWRSAYGHFEERLEPALRYHEADPNKIAELEFLIGRVGNAARASDPAGMAKVIGVFEEKLAILLPIIPQATEAALTH